MGSIVDDIHDRMREGVQITAEIERLKAGRIAKEASDGSSADYYKLPAGATQLQELISYKNMNAQVGEIFRACYRMGQVHHSPSLRDAKKILFYAQAEVDRLEKQLGY